MLFNHDLGIFLAGILSATAQISFRDGQSFLKPQEDYDLTAEMSAAVLNRMF